MTVGPLLALLVAFAEPAVETGDSLRPRAAVHVAPHQRPSRAMGVVVMGYLSPRGLPPLAGQVVVTDTGLVFHSHDGLTVESYPLAGQAVSLAYVERDATRPVYVFRLPGSVFTTEGPGSLLDVALGHGWLDTLHSREWAPERGLAAADDTAAFRAIAHQIGAGSYADTLYALFGRPERPVGLVGGRGRSAGRLGEYLAQRDSLALDPSRMTSEGQLRHALAHELGHRWQARAPGQLAVLWQGVPRIRDPKRYGHGSAIEHQAEAIAFAVHFLQATVRAPPTDASALLAQYERMVPGTRLIARYLALQPIYAAHPLRRQLTVGDPPASR